VGKSLRELIYPTDRSIVDELLAELVEGIQTAAKIDVRLRSEGDDEQFLWVQISATVMSNNDSSDSRAIYVAVEDISQAKHAEAQIQYQLSHDNLTGLMNRVQFISEVDAAIAAANIDQQPFMLLFFDLDRFKIINDSLGHDIGDRLLQAIAQRLAGAIDVSGVLARFGGDEFGFLLPNAHSLELGQQACEKILFLLSEPFSIERYELSVDRSVGLAKFPDHGSSKVALVQSADIAMYHVKGNGKINYAIFDASMNKDRFAQIQIEQELRRALAKGELEVYYQPVVSLVGGEIVGVEALARWNHKRLGLMEPSVFLDLAEEAGLVADLDSFVQRKAMQQVTQWHALDHDIFVSVNTSAAQLNQEVFTASFEAMLSEVGIAPSTVKLELTEKTLIRIKQSIVDQLSYLRDLGVGIAADDFGMGYSSLAYLRDFPLTSLKIDQSFVSDIKDENDTASLVDAILAVAHGLGLSVVAEGVETVAQIRYLFVRDCDEAQGYIFSAPLSA
jgi:diguanylate cyclase (GGDEF)-like protein